MEIINGWIIVGRGSKTSYGKYNVIAICPLCKEESDRSKYTLKTTSSCQKCYLDKIRVDGVASARSRVKRNLIINQAKKRNLEMSLTDEELNILWSSNCHYCGSPPNNKMTGSGKRATEVFVYSGLDRVDNSFGYVSGNVVPCCKICNHSKESLSIEDWFQWVSRVYISLKEGGRI